MSTTNDDSEYHQELRTFSLKLLHMKLFSSYAGVFNLLHKISIYAETLVISL
jgi:hypothetical protein